MSREDFSMAHMLTEFKVKYGRDAKPEERAKLEDISKQVEELDKRIAALEQAKPTSKPFARGKVQRGSDAEFNNLAAKLKEISQRDPRGHCEI
jgi:hypothetical protein